MFLRQAILRDMRKHPGRHVLLSFYLTTAGFITQNIAGDLELPHVAASRGSDLGRDVFSPLGFSRVEYVLRRATAVVATNVHHEHYVRAITGRTHGVRTIYNPLPPGVAPVWRPSGAPRVRLVTLGGYSLKKGTHLLVESVRQLLAEGLPVELAIAGPRAPQGYWDEMQNDLRPPAFTTAGMLKQEETEPFLLSGDVFCSASLSEGCSNVTMTALGLGMPIVSTGTGSLPDLAAELEHVRMTPPGDVEAFTDALRETVQSILDGTLHVDAGAVRRATAALDPEGEQRHWQEVLEDALRQGVPMPRRG
jgi:glycosyltransferase involved in cell wall biosynthesis